LRDERGGCGQHLMRSTKGKDVCLDARDSYSIMLRPPRRTAAESSNHHFVSVGNAGSPAIVAVLDVHSNQAVTRHARDGRVCVSTSNGAHKHVPWLSSRLIKWPEVKRGCVVGL